MSIYDKVPAIVKNKIVREEIKFQGKTIIREKIEKEWNIPKIITSDIGYQLMFGNMPSTATNSTDCGIVSVELQIK